MIVGSPPPRSIRHHPPLLQQADWNELYWTTGDGGPQTDPNDSSQDVTNLLGAMIRISVPSFAGAELLYDIPPGNYRGENMDAIPRVDDVREPKMSPLRP